MSNATFLGLLIGIQLGFTALDLGERWASRKSRYGGEPVRVLTVAFLTLTVVVYLGIQGGLTWLAPAATTTLDRAQEWFAERVGRPAEPAETMGTGPLVLLCIACFYVSGLFDYLAHRFFNHSRPFWWTHEYHHLPREVFVALPGLAVRPFAVFTTVMVTVSTVAFAYGLLALLGWPMWDLRPLKLFVLANALILTTSHSSFLRQWWWPHHALRCLLLTTPQEHLVHHSVEVRGNYGNVTTLWDRLLGTYVDPTKPENQGLRLGLGYDQDFLGTITFSLLKLPRRWRERLQLARYCNLDGEEADGGGEETKTAATASRAAAAAVDPSSSRSVSG